ncbi:MAG: hypothetical protein HKN91_06925 [Acidimicrobiia bacterium]|nr:hypothetical protein [Acidimicrobiia bacterium]
MELVIGSLSVIAVVALVAYLIRRNAIQKELLGGRDVADPGGPVDEPYPPGSRPAGPGAESMNVGDAGDLYPGPLPHQD